MNFNLLLKKVRHGMLKVHKWKNSADYWERRYQLGCDSGAGSYNRLALFKAEIINEFVKKNNIISVVEWGWGDGNQLNLAQYPQYTGIDVSLKAVEMCKKIFCEDYTKKFYCNMPGQLPCEVTRGGGMIWHYH